MQSCNSYFAQLIGYKSPKQLVGTSIANHFSKQVVRRAFLSKLHAEGACISEFKFITKEGKNIWVVVYAVINVKEKYIDEVVVDITDRKVMENLLISNENRFRSMIEKASDLIIILGKDRSVLYLSPSFETELGYSPTNFFEVDIIDYINPEDKSKLNELLSCKAEQKTASYEIRVNHKEGYEKTFECKATDLSNDPAIGGIIVNARDITDKIKARNDMRAALLKETELSRQKSQFISTVSHEFRTPLTNISLNIQLLSKYLQNNRPEKQQQAINRLLNAEKRLTALLNEVSLVSKDQSGRLSFVPELWDLSLLTDDMLEQIDYQLQPNIKIQTLKGNEVKAPMDKTLLTHILGNLVSNAIKYSPKDMPIDLLIGYTNTQKYVIKVTDRGIGVPKEEQKFLFDPYFRASNAKAISGTGLGLNIVMRCVELHGGQIHIDSEVGEGTSITVTIPLDVQ